MKIGVVGAGFVGAAIVRYFSQVHQVHIYDKYSYINNRETDRQAVNSCELVFVAVPTPTGTDGWSCDLAELNDVFSWLETPTCIKSTVPPGTTEAIGYQQRVPVGFSPEYIGESGGHMWGELDRCGFVIVGGDDEIFQRVSSAYAAVSKRLPIYHTSSTAAELCKYMENAFLATKVSFVNQFFDIAQAWGIDFEELCQLWKLDERIGKTHTSVASERGFGGKCLPKDIRAIISATQGKTCTDLLESVVRYNDRIRAAALR